MNTHACETFPLSLSPPRRRDNRPPGSLDVIRPSIDSKTFIPEEGNDTEIQKMQAGSYAAHDTSPHTYEYEPRALGTAWLDSE